MGMTSELCADFHRMGPLTESDRERLRMLVIDFAAASCAGCRLNHDFNEAVGGVVLPMGGAEESHVLFRARKVPARTAAFMNAVYAHGAELDDGNKRAAGHPGVHLISAVFALAEKEECPDRDVFEALAVGYEAFIRISSAAQPGMVHRGFHSTGTAGALACAVACARLYRLDASGIEDALGLASTMCAGLLSYGDSRPAIKPLNPGRAAEAGLFAAQLARAGIRGPSEALEGPNGWFHAMADSIQVDFLRGSDHLLLHDCYFKLYPSCRHTHCGIDAAVALHGELDGRTIERIRIHIYPNAIRLAGIPRPKTPDETKFSIPYTLACALAKGGYGMEDMDVARVPDSIWNLAAKTEMIPDETMEDRRKGIRGALVEVTLSDGTVLSRRVLVPRGDPENPLSRAEIVRKLHSCAAGLADESAIDRFLAHVDAMDAGTENRFINPMTLLGNLR